MSEWVPSEDDIKATSDYRADLEVITELDAPGEDDAEAASRHRADLEAIEERS